MKKSLIIPLLAALLLPIAHGSAKQPTTIKTAELQWPIAVNSVPEGAKVYYNGELLCPATPGVISVPAQGEITPDKKNMDRAYEEAKQRSAIKLTFVKDGYHPVEKVLYPSVTYQKIGLIKQYVFDWPKTVTVNMTQDPNSAYAKDTSIPAGEAQNVVNRDRPGQTALERTVIRWYFESEPQGARIFWRVISSVPDQVKNTNELWLGNTPFEETRSFNIQGLTYENSRDVQIEIKVRRNGYLDQTKRFNVRQAIDQQEISSFFDMIKTDE